MLNIVLVNPEIPFNTGNIGRSCVATGTMLHLVGKLGFKIESKEIRRSGLDYWPNLNYRRYADWEEFLAVNHPQEENLFFLSTKGTKSYLSPLGWAHTFFLMLVLHAHRINLPQKTYRQYTPICWALHLFLQKKIIVPSFTSQLCQPVTIFDKLIGISQISSIS